VLENLFLRATIEPPKVMLSSESLSVLRGLLEHDDFVALLPEGLVRDQIRTGQLVELYSLDETPWLSLSCLTSRIWRKRKRQVSQNTAGRVDEKNLSECAEW